MLLQYYIQSTVLRSTTYRVLSSEVLHTDYCPHKYYIQSTVLRMFTHGQAYCRQVCGTYSEAKPSEYLLKKYLIN